MLKFPAVYGFIKELQQNLHICTCQPRHIMCRNDSMKSRLGYLSISYLIGQSTLKCFLLMDVAVELDTQTMREMYHFYFNNKLMRRMCPSKWDQVATKMGKLSNDGNYNS